MPSAPNTSTSSARADKALAEKLAGKGALSWCRQPDGGMEVIAKSGKDLWFTAAQVKKAASGAKSALGKEPNMQARESKQEEKNGSTPKKPVTPKAK